MYPGEVPPDLQRLSMIEEILIDKIRGGQTAYSGNVINFKQDICRLFNSLPPTPEQVNAVVLGVKNTPSGLACLRVRADVVRKALIWLKANNRYYRDIIIDQIQLNNLPSDGSYESFLQSFDDENSEETSDQTEQNLITESCFPQFENTNQDQEISQALRQFYWPNLKESAINEFSTEGIIAQAFPTLFPFGNADLNYPRKKKISPLRYF